MKKKFCAFLLCMALLSSFTVPASAEFDSSDSSHLYDIWRQITGTASYSTIYDWIKNLDTNVSSLKSSFSDTRQSVNPVAYFAQQIYNKLGDSKDYSSILNNIYKNTSSIYSRLADLADIKENTYQSSTAVNRMETVLGKINDSVLGSYTKLSGINDALYYTDLERKSISNILVEFMGIFDNAEFLELFDSADSEHFQYYSNPMSRNSLLTAASLTLNGFFKPELSDGVSASQPTLYKLLYDLWTVHADADDLALKNANKANEDAATDAFVNGSSSKTSLGVGDIGNLKDIGGSFNDLTSLNGQSSVTSFLNGLTSADGTGQGWFSEATRASLDAVSTPVTTTNLVHKTWCGEKALIATVSEDSVNTVASPAPAADLDPYNMSGFEDNYNWLWGDAS